MKRSFLIALAIGLGTLLWVLSGPLLGNGGQPELQKAPAQLAAADARQEVRVRLQTAERHVAEVVVNGRTEANREVMLRTEQAGAVIELPAEKGTLLEEGQLVARLAERDRQAAVEEARALLASRQLEYDAAKQLRERGHAAETHYVMARAQLEQAQTALRRAELAQEQLSVRAPFAAVLEERPVELGDVLQLGEVVGRLVDLDPLLAVASVNERDVGAMRLGARGEARLADGEVREGSIRYIARAADPETRTFRVELALPNPDHSLKAGMTAELRLPLGERMAHLISPAILVLSDEGPVGVRSVNEDDEVEFHPVEILEQRPEGVWVAGLPEQVRLITLGQNYVEAGQRVRAMDEAEVAAGRTGSEEAGS